MKKLLFLLFFSLFFLFPDKVFASCTVQEKANLKKLVSNVNISYDYQISGSRAIFSIKLNNVGPELYFKDEEGNSYYGYDAGEFILYNYYQNRSYTFTFYGTSNCRLEEVGKLYATTPSYNPYYNLSVCDDAKEYKLCQKWVSHSLNRSEFIEQVNNYKKENLKIDDTEINKKISVIDFAMSFIRMYGVYIVIAIVVIVIVVKTIKYKRDTFGF